MDRERRTDGGTSLEAERRNGSHGEPGRSAASPQAAAPPDPEVAAVARRRRFTAEYKQGILEAADACREPGELGRLLRREGLYSSHLVAWRKARRAGGFRALDQKRGRKPVERNPLEQKVQQLEKENARLRGQLKKAETILEVQGKVAGLLGFSLIDGKSC